MLEKDAMDILMRFLDKKVRESEEEITSKGILSDDKAVPLILKTQFNHIAHLEEIMDRRFAEVDARFARLERNLFGGFAALGFLVTFFGSFTAVLLRFSR